MDPGSLLLFCRSWLLVEGTIFDNYIHNTLRLFDGRANFPFTISETKCDYKYETGIYELPHKLLNKLGLKILGNSKISEKIQNFIELLCSACSPSRNKHFGSSIKNLL